MNFQEVLNEAVKSDSIEESHRMMKQYSFGIEHIACDDAELRYINLGDTYTDTICSEHGKLFICSWGSWLESVEQQQNIDNETITCGYCSHRTLIDPDNFRDTVCESCDNKVMD